MLDIILEEKKHSYVISKVFGTAMTAVACLSFALSLLQITEVKFNNEKKPQNNTASHRHRNGFSQPHFPDNPPGCVFFLWERQVNFHGQKWSRNLALSVSNLLSV